MTVTSVVPDTASRTLTLTAEYPATTERVWQLWADPRLLERWWGPPSYPSTFTEHDLRAGGRAAYYMTGPDGERMHGWWEFTEVEDGRALELVDGFADADGTPSTEMPSSRIRVTVEQDGDTARMVMVTTFPSDDAMEKLLAMGMDEGMKLALGQTDALLA